VVQVSGCGVSARALTPYPGDESRLEIEASWFLRKESWFEKKESRLEKTSLTFHHPYATVTSSESGLNIILSIVCSEAFNTCYFLTLNDGISHSTTSGNVIFLYTNTRINFLARCKKNPVEGTSNF
jgi:hypothetical protein